MLGRVGRLRPRAADVSDTDATEQSAPAPPGRTRALPAAFAPFAALGRRSRIVLLASLAALLLLALAAALVLRWDGVYPGVRVAGADLGGLDRAQAAARLDEVARGWEATPLTLAAPQGSYTFSRADLGLSYDRDAVLARAHEQGRTGGIPARLATIARLAWSGAEVPAAYRADEALLRDRVRGLAGETDVEPRDGDLRIEDGRVVVVPPVEGRGLDTEAAVALLLATLTPDSPTALTLPVAEHLQPRINAPVLVAARTRAELLLTPVSLEGAELAHRYDAATIGSWLTVRRDPGDAATPLTVAIERDRVLAAVRGLSDRVYREPRDARYAFDRASGGFKVTEPSINGRYLDVERTAALVVAALERHGAPSGRTVEVVTQERYPALSTGAVESASQRAATSYLAGPLVFRFGEQSWTLAVPDLAAWLTIEAVGPPEGYRLAFDEDALSDYIIGLKPKIDRPAVDAGYTMDDGTEFYRVTSPSRVGYRLDGPETYRQAMAALLGGAPARPGRAGERVVELPVATLRPTVTEADVAAMEPERWIDVDLSAQRVRAVIGRKVVHTAVMSSGKQKWETPTGTFYINRRVENETMTSEAIGAEDHYRLENVLYTQYFTNEGHALHYSWWKEPGSFGIPTSHGCISMQLKDSEYFWNFARIGTRVTIHGKTPIR